MSIQTQQHSDNVAINVLIAWSIRCIVLSSSMWYHGKTVTAHVRRSRDVHVHFCVDDLVAISTHSCTSVCLPEWACPWPCKIKAVYDGVLYTCMWQHFGSLDPFAKPWSTSFVQIGGETTLLKATSIIVDKFGGQIGRSSGSFGMLQSSILCLAGLLDDFQSVKKFSKGFKGRWAFEMINTGLWGTHLWWSKQPLHYSQI